MARTGAWSPFKTLFIFFYERGFIIDPLAPNKSNFIIFLDCYFCYSMWYISLVETPFCDVLNKGGWAKIHPGNVSQTNSLHRVALFAPSGDNYCLLFSTKRKEYMMGAVCLRSHNIIIWMRKQCFHTLQPPINLIYLIISHSQKGKLDLSFWISFCTMSTDHHHHNRHHQRTNPTGCISSEWWMMRLLFYCSQVFQGCL